MKRALLIILGLFVLSQFVQTDKRNPTNDQKLEMEAPSNIGHMLKVACYDCHSNDTKWPFYSYIAPISWTVAAHVKDGRSALNFSIWETYSKEQKEKYLKEIFRTVYASMPLPSYIAFHADADLSKAQRQEIRNWILSLGIKP
jgi:hypothetical protein